MMKVLNRENKEAEASYDVFKKHSQWGDVWRRLSRNKLAMAAMFGVVGLALMAIFAGVIFPGGYQKIDPINAFQNPSWAHLLGTDNFGRDVLTRIAYGARMSLLVSVLSVVFAIAAGAFIGTTAGYFGGKYETVTMRGLDVFMAIPSFLMALTISTALGGGTVNTAIAIAVGSTPSFARVTRASVLTIKRQQFIEAATAIGTSDMKIIVKHMLPNIFAPILVEGTLRIGAGIMVISALSFIGLGVAPPTPEWGSMMSQGMEYFRQFPWLVTFPGIFIIITIFSFNLFGDGLRDALDPRLKR